MGNDSTKAKNEHYESMQQRLQRQQQLQQQLQHQQLNSYNNYSQNASTSNDNIRYRNEHSVSIPPKIATQELPTAQVQQQTNFQNKYVSENSKCDNAIHTQVYFSNVNDEGNFLQAKTNSFESFDDQETKSEESLVIKKALNALNLKPNLIDGFYKMGFKNLFKIQDEILRVMTVDPPKNVIAQSHFGYEKTVAVLLGAMNKVDTSQNYPQVLFLSSTYELAVQTGNYATELTKCCPEISIKCAVRGEDAREKLTQHIIIGTVGKVLDWSTKYRLFDLRKITVFILDEADAMVSRLHSECTRIHKMLSSTCQMLFFTPTYNQEIMNFADVLVKDRVILKSKLNKNILANIQQYYVICTNGKDKYQAFLNIFTTILDTQTIVFCFNKRTAHWLAEKLSKNGYKVPVYTGDLHTEKTDVLGRFKSGQDKVLITTNILSRGVDFDKVSIVINYDLPKDLNGQADCDTYFHRITKSRHFKYSTTINIVDSPEGLNIIHALENHFNISMKQFNSNYLDEVAKTLSNNQNNEKISEFNGEIVEQVTHMDDDIEKNFETDHEATVPLKQLTQSNPFQKAARNPETQQDMLVQRFFHDIAETVCRFTPQLQEKAKSEIMNIMTKLEIQNLSQQSN